MMIVRILFLTALTGLLCAAPAWADEIQLAGTYTVQGWEPDGDRAATPNYTGTITITKLGDAYKLSGQMDGESYSGIGFMGDDGVSFSFAYRGSDGEAGQSVGQYRNGIWVVYWIPIDSKTGRVGQELWAQSEP
jgi:hypothetical protein